MAGLSEMVRIPEKIHNIIYDSDLSYSSRYENTFGYTMVYIINEGCKDKTFFTVEKHDKTNEILDDSNGFVNGFKVVRMANGECAYINEETGILLPYRYDIAGNFNEHGFAMIAKNGRVTWINKEFEYLSIDGTMQKQTEDSFGCYRSTWSRVYDFSTGSIPLSKVGYFSETAYFRIDGKLQEFTVIEEEIPKTKFNNCKINLVPFDRDGWSIDIENNRILYVGENGGSECSIEYFINYIISNYSFEQIFKFGDGRICEQKGVSAIVVMMTKMLNFRGLFSGHANAERADKKPHAKVLVPSSKIKKE